ncbi:DUF866 domain-containing protein [Hamiltosporidium magnivora]|uniref:DUF866 domain-containing protein n=1 Tax=Hamiltosporidium magnivora TaxID=148818 RepID=A0A4Q9LNI8_9MICR|nr:hypothetical protein CWI36_0017p0050 [Hamiltosporidium magnivora]TBU09894.1 DUF866 domain-containing protein [Hamiltosporidium magnivora]
MKYDLFVAGTFQGVSNIMVEQTFSLEIKCSYCHKTHKNHVIVTDESKQYNNKDEPVNLKVKCAECGKQMTITVHIPINSTKYKYTNKDIMNEYEVDLYLNPKKDNSFHVSTLDCRGCFIEKIDDLKCSVLSEWDIFFKDVEIFDGYVRLEDLKGRVTTIEDFSINFIKS